MKKQINPTIKAHLIRGAFYLLLLVAVCAIPFALAQRSKLSSTKAQAIKAPPTKAQIAAASGKVLQSGAPGAVAGRAAGTRGGCIVVNGDFETGSLPPWVNTGDTSFTGVDSSNPHGGSFELFSGPTSSDGFVDQVIPTAAGTGYDVTFWLANTDTSGENRFGSS